MSDSQLWWCAYNQRWQANPCQCNSYDILRPCGWVDIEKWKLPMPDAIGERNMSDKPKCNTCGKDAYPSMGDTCHKCRNYLHYAQMLSAGISQRTGKCPTSAPPSYAQVNRLRQLGVIGPDEAILCCTVHCSDQLDVLITESRTI